MTLDLRRGAPDLSAVLLPGERPLALERIGEPLIGQDRIDNRARRAEGARRRQADGSRPRSRAASIALAPVTGLLALIGGPSWGVDFDRLLGGIISDGEPGSLADQLRQAVAASGINEAQLLITDRRLALTRADSIPPVGTQARAELAFAVDRTAVTALTRRGWLLQRGRLRVAFADGSWTAVLTGMFATRAARRLIAAHHGAATTRPQ